MLLRCSKCHLEKPETEYYKWSGKSTSSAARRGFAWECKTCKCIAATEYQKRPEVKARIRKVGRARRLKYEFGITPEQYDAMEIAQEGNCAICGEKQFEKRNKGPQPNKLCVDHCHKTKVVRGLLCTQCNVGLGFFEDNINWLLQAVQYLENSRKLKVV